ncbi:MAG TPA: pitrilysin family protein [Vicinamibacterales bacterium]|nr:pitrilysin family protein [Vicinamibacterales bacterium]
MRSRLVGALILVALCGLTLNSQTPARPAPQAAPIPDISYTKFVLKNGLTLLVHEDHKAPIAAVNVWYHVGSKNEKPGRTGFAHLFEHLMFNGSEHYNNDYFKAVEPVGATDLNGTTNEDRTNYFQNVPVSALDRILWLESDRMGHLVGVIDKARLDEQRGVVQNEKRQGENGPYGKSFITVAENTYPKGHPYSWSVIGSMDDLNAASLEDVKGWFAEYYGAANATLVVAGDVNPADIKQRVEKFFGDIPSGPPLIKPKAWVAKRTGVQRQTMQDRVPQTRIIKVWNVAQFGTADSTYLGLVVDLLAGGESSRLYKRLVYRDRTATSVVGFQDDREISGQVWFWADVQPGGDAKAVERALDEEIGTFIAKGPTAEEVQRARTQALSGYVRGIERIGGFGGKSDLLARGQVLLGDPEAYLKDQREIQAATAADLQGAAQRWLSDGVYVLEVTPFAEYETTKSTADRTKLPDANQPPDAPLPASQTATLSNGVKVVLANRKAVPVVRMTMILDGGFSADRADLPGVASMTAAMLTQGTSTRTALQLADQRALIAADIGAGADLDTSTVSLSVLTERLDPALDLFADVLLNPAFPQADLDRLKKNALANIEQEKVDPIGVALRVLPGLLYGPGHAYAQPLTGSGTEASVNAMTRADLSAFHQAWFKPNRATLIVAGDITMEALTAKLERVFKTWKGGTVPTKNIPTVPALARDQIYIVDRPGAEQSVVISGQLIAPKKNPDEFAFTMFNDAFGGAFGSRVNLNLREDKHWSYGAGSFAFDARGQRMWIVYAPVQTDKTRESVIEMIKELKAVIDDRPITAVEVQEAKDRQTRTMAGRWETTGAIRSALQEIATFDLPADYYATFAQNVRAVTPAQVTSAVSKSVTGRKVWVIVGDRAKIEESLKGLNLGEIRLLDGDGKIKK